MTVTPCNRLPIQNHCDTTIIPGGKPRSGPSGRFGDRSGGRPSGRPRKALGVITAY